ncbi:MAG: MBL fold metallo-hydrolase [Acidobacteria bacterium]|nr:MBL fold metallo-hydrolase [Acidobacteriota bacterium]
MYRLILGVVVLLIVVGAKLAPAAQQQDFSKVEIKTQKVAGNVYMLEGSGGNIGVSAGPDGMLIIDDQFAPLADKIKTALKSLNSGQLKFLLNTHHHGDHTGGNEIFGKDTLIVAHTNVRKRLESKPKEAQPVVTYDKSISVHFNGEEVQAMYFANGHTDNDSIIYFTKSNVAHFGDTFSPGRFPFVDLSGGGDVDGLVSSLSEAINRLPADVKIIPGHGSVLTLEDVKSYRDMIADTADIVRKQMAAGKTMDQIKAQGMPDKYKNLGTGFVKTDTWIQVIYNSLSKKK